MIDVWSLGCIVAELLTGNALFVGENNIDQLAVIAEALGPIPTSWQMKETERQSQKEGQKEREKGDDRDHDEVYANLGQVSRSLSPPRSLSLSSSPSLHTVSVPLSSSTTTTTKVYDWVYNFSLPRYSDNSVLSFANPTTSRRSVVITSNEMNMKTLSLSSFSDDQSLALPLSLSVAVANAANAVNQHRHQGHALTSSSFSQSQSQSQGMTNLTSHSFVMTTQGKSVRDYNMRNIAEILHSYQFTSERERDNRRERDSELEREIEREGQFSLLLQSAVDFVVQCLQYLPEHRLPTTKSSNGGIDGERDGSALTHPFLCR
jgi:hypothetical protein